VGNLGAFPVGLGTFFSFFFAFWSSLVVSMLLYTEKLFQHLLPTYTGTFLLGHRHETEGAVTLHLNLYKAKTLRLLNGIIKAVPRL
jgi:hypothetical protein